MNQFGYWVDLRSVKLDEDGVLVSTIQAFPYGEYDHPVYGKIDFNPTMGGQLAENVNMNVRGQELDIDYDHKAQSGEAAGWVKRAEARSDGVYLTVEWTKKAWNAIKDGAYRYFSPEFKDEWKHPKTGQVHKNVLFGGGITNRPFLKDILPLNLSELYAEQKEGTGMDPKELRKLLGLPEDATDEQVNTALQERLKEPEQKVTETPEQKAAREAEEAKKKDEPVLVGLSEEVIKRLTESGNADVKALTEAVSTLQKTVQTQGAALQLAETANVVKRLSEPDAETKRALSPASQTKLQEVLLAAPRDVAANIVKLMETVVGKGGTIQLGETVINPSNHEGGGTGNEATKKFSEEVQKVIDADKLSYGDAVERVASLQPDLFEAHRQASYAFREQ